MTLPKIISREDAARLLMHLSLDDAIGLRNRVALQLCYRAGLRINEVCHLSVADVDVKKGYVYVQQGKGKTDRVVPLDPETAELCSQWLDIRPATESSFFLVTIAISVRGKRFDGPISDRYFRELCRRLSHETGVWINGNHRRKPVHPHTFRHCFATERLEEGFSLVDVQRLLGHSSITATSIYLHVRPNVLRAKMQTITPVGGETE